MLYLVASDAAASERSRFGVSFVITPHRKMTEQEDMQNIESLAMSKFEVSFYTLPFMAESSPICIQWVDTLLFAAELLPVSALTTISIEKFNKLSCKS